MTTSDQIPLAEIRKRIFLSFSSKRLDAGLVPLDGRWVTRLDREKELRRRRRSGWLAFINLTLLAAGLFLLAALPIGLLLTIAY